MATKLYSKATAIRAIADELREVLAKKNAVSAGYHLPGVLNVFTDRPSRAGEALYEQTTVAQRLVAWVTTYMKRTGGVQQVSVQTSAPESTRPLSGVVVIPAPHTRESAMDQTIRLKRRCPQAVVGLILPQAAYDDNRWAPLLRQLSKVASLPVGIPIYDKSLTVSHVSWTTVLELPSQPSGQWNLWFVC
jgi:hypothetical protein